MRWRITVVEPAEPDNGSLTLVFSDNPLALRQWTIVDQQRKTTTVSISDAAIRCGARPRAVCISGSVMPPAAANINN